MAKKMKVKKISQAGVPSPDTGKYVFFVVIAIVILMLGFGTGRATSSGGQAIVSQNKATPIGEAFSQYGPKDIVGIVPVGFARSPEGAATAATAYVGLTSRLYFAEDQLYNVSVGQITTPAFRAGFTEGFAQARLDARRVYAQDRQAFLRELPVGYYIESAEQDKVTVVIWSVYMLAARPEFDGRTESKAHVIELVWSEDNWKVQGWVTGPGPTPKWQAPANTILSVDDFLEVIQPFSGGYDFVPSF